MSKLILRIFMGVIAASVLFLFNTFVIPESLSQDDRFNTFMNVCYLACIVVPCAIYYTKTPPGTDNRG